MTSMNKKACRRTIKNINRLRQKLSKSQSRLDYMKVQARISNNLYQSMTVQLILTDAALKEAASAVKTVKKKMQ